jgi:hypothetical protein
MSDVTTVAASGGTTPVDTSKTTTSDKTTGTSFKETLAKVSGHKYAEIKDGDRKGMFVNQSGNARDGDAFKLVERDGHEFHVYGEGKDRKVFEVAVTTSKKS